MHLTRAEFVLFLILFLLLAGVFAFNIWAGGTITSPQTLANDLWAPSESPQDWNVQNLAVVRYRALFRLIVRGTWSLLFAPTDALAFYWTFVAWSFIFFYGAVVALYFFLRLLEFDRRTAFIGCLLFQSAPPVLLAYKYPVYTREDPLAYLLVLLGLIAVFKSKAWWMSLIAVLAVLTRETTLIVPLAYFVAAKDPWRKKILVCIPPAFAFIGIRWLWGGESGNPFESSILNFMFPWETGAFLFCVFGVLWAPYIMGLIYRWHSNVISHLGWRTLTQSGPLVLLAVLAASLSIARAREVRITFILFPWALTFALDWLRRNSAYLLDLAERFQFWLFASIVLATISGVVLYFHLTSPELMRDYLADFKNGYWLVIGTLNLSALIALLAPGLGRSGLNRTFSEKSTEH